jgi:hypothetical protein
MSFVKKTMRCLVSKHLENDLKERCELLAAQIGSKDPTFIRLTGKETDPRKHPTLPWVESVDVEYEAADEG